MDAVLIPDFPEIIIVSGSRKATFAAHRDVVEAFLRKFPRTATIVEGGANGIDKIARQLAEDLGFDSVTMWANWTRRKKAAGPIRNTKMLDWACKLASPHTLVVLAFPAPDSIGTRDFITKAEGLGVPTIVCEIEA